MGDLRENTNVGGRQETRAKYRTFAAKTGYWTGMLEWQQMFSHMFMFPRRQYGLCHNQNSRSVLPLYNQTIKDTECIQSVFLTRIYLCTEGN